MSAYPPFTWLFDFMIISPTSCDLERHAEARWQRYRLITTLCSYVHLYLSQHIQSTRLRPSSQPFVWKSKDPAIFIVYLDKARSAINSLPSVLKRGATFRWFAFCDDGSLSSPSRDKPARESSRARGIESSAPSIVECERQPVCVLFMTSAKRGAPPLSLERSLLARSGCPGSPEHFSQLLRKSPSNERSSRMRWHSSRDKTRAPRWQDACTRRCRREKKQNPLASSALDKISSSF